MALIDCPDCGSKVSDSAKTCPNCHSNIVSYVTTEKWKKRILVWWPSVVLFIVAFIILSIIF